MHTVVALPRWVVMSVAWEGLMLRAKAITSFLDDGYDGGAFGRHVFSREPSQLWQLAVLLLWLWMTTANDDKSIAWQARSRPKVEAELLVVAAFSGLQDNTCGIGIVRKLGMQRIMAAGKVHGRLDSLSWRALFQAATAVTLPGQPNLLQPCPTSPRTRQPRRPITSRATRALSASPLSAPSWRAELRDWQLAPRLPKAVRPARSPNHALAAADLQPPTPPLALPELSEAINGDSHGMSTPPAGSSSLQGSAQGPLPPCSASDTTVPFLRAPTTPSSTSGREELNLKSSQPPAKSAAFPPHGFPISRT
ncbi:hypothetical protein HU200_039951 [Digitaria exilis]|uniref:Uncharacterized protein n=1 Tax=Digitaria exilis TaxID=1010633 RepID=A0A835EKH5_9POAL|nr:hypothetical protein HU200_039951 [Digitaria exilis]